MDARRHSRLYSSVHKFVEFLLTVQVLNDSSPPSEKTTNDD
jgi:hypothetical protein